MKNYGVRWASAIVLIAVLTLMVAACGSTESGSSSMSAADGQALLEERCAVCHDLERTTSQQKTADEWEDTVTRMVQKGAVLTEDEQQVLIAYLAEEYGP